MIMVNLDNTVGTFVFQVCAVILLVCCPETEVLVLRKSAVYIHTDFLWYFSALIVAATAVTGTVACSSASIKVLPVTDDESCEIKVNGSKPGTVTALNVGATLVRLEVKSPDGSSSQVAVCLLGHLSSVFFLLWHIF